MYTTHATLLFAFVVFTKHHLGRGRQSTDGMVFHRPSHFGRKALVIKPGYEGKQVYKTTNRSAKAAGRGSLLMKSRKVKKKQLKINAEEVNKILSIKNDQEFTNKVMQMMKDDDSDVLKDIDEDENPMIFSNLRNDKPTYTKSKLSSKRKLMIQSSKRSFITQPPFDMTNWDSGFDYQFNDQLPESPQSLQSLPSLPAQQFPAQQLPAQQSLAQQQQQQPHNSISMQESQTTQEPHIRISHQKSHSLESLNHTLSKATDIDYSDEKASRVCKPGPPVASNKRLPNCLLIGDSITLSSSYSVAAALETKCTVQMAPFSKGGGALDSQYGLDCIQFLLSTTNLSPTRYDVIIFNFGMHDIDFSNQFPEEFNDEASYKSNLGRLKKILLRTKAGVAFALTTPVTYNKEKNDLVVRYNKIAKRVMSKQPSVDVIDLYDFVIDNCGGVPFKHCFMMKKPNDVHYGLAGSIMLGKQIAAKIAMILKERNLWVKSGFSLPESTNFTKPLFTNLKEDSVKCSVDANVPTRCPSDTTCVSNAISRSGYACCLLENGIDCKDSFHCCPENTICHTKCSPKWCSCIKK